MAGDLKAGRAAVDSALAHIRAPRGQGKLVFTRIYEDAARVAADAADGMAGAGVELPDLAGVPISIKDLFDVAGEPTRAGARLLEDAAPATRDAEVVRRLRRAGAAIVGKTNMTEFAFSGLGLNPHYGTPLNVWDRPNARIPGGSSSGAAISITDGMAAAAIGTDTGGSCRIPAALNGLVGFKPTARTVPTTGAIPLSTSYDSVGPLARNVAMCARIHAVLSDSDQRVRPVAPVQLRLGVVTNYVVDGMDVAVSSIFEAALKRISRSGAVLQEIRLPVLDELPALFVNGGLVAAEAYEWHRGLLERRSAEYDPRVAVRIRRGSLISASDYLALQRLRRILVDRWVQQVDSFDAIVMPTVPMVAPMICELDDDEAYGRVNLLMLRNPTVVNALDGCAITIPCHVPDDPPVGMMLATTAGRDWKLLSAAAALERIL
jgi:aspartyl-tRNA(Asn)/glutamyl-tRNA(Gln) amidotransferase subunit A